MSASTQSILGERSFRFLARYSVILACAQVGCIAFSLAKIVISQAVAILIIAASVAAGRAYAARLGSNDAAPADRDARPWRKLLGLPLVMLVALGCIYGLTWIAAWTKPDLSWDGNSYHIPMIHMWALRGYIHWIQFDYDPGAGWTFFLQWLCNGYPKGAETIAFLLVRAVGSSNPVNTGNLVFLPMGVAGVVVTSRAFGASRPAAYTCGLAFGLIPVLVSQGNTAYVDAALADTIAGLVGCLSVVLAELRQDRPATSLLPAMGSAIGLTAASKSSGLAPAMLAAAAIAATVPWRARLKPAAERGPLLRRGAGFLAASAGIAFCVTGYWYVRSYVYTGNPLSPVKLALLGHTIFPGVPLKDSISENFLTPDFMASWGSWRRIGFTWLQGAVNPPSPAPGQPWPESIRYYDARLGGIGYLWLFGCVPAVAYVVFTLARDWRRRSETVSIEPAAVLPVLCVVFGAFAAVPMNWWCRYTMWIYAAGLPCLAIGVDRIWAMRRGVAPVLTRAWIVGAFALSIFEAAYAFRYAALAGQFIVFAEPVTWTPSGVWHALTVYNDPKYFFLNMTPMDEEVVRRGDAVAMAQLDVGGGPLLGVLSMPVGLRDIVLLSWDIANDEAKLRSLLLEHRVRYLFWNDSVPVPAPVARLSLRDSRTPGYWHLFEVGPGAPMGPTDVRAK